MDQDELVYLRKKIGQLEDMILRMNEKIGHVLNGFLTHRKKQVAGQKHALQEEEDVCISLLTELNGTTRKTNDKTNSGNKFTNRASTSSTHYDNKDPEYFPRITRQTQQKLTSKQYHNSRSFNKSNLELSGGGIDIDSDGAEFDLLDLEQIGSSRSRGLTSTATPRIETSKLTSTRSSKLGRQDKLKSQPIPGPNPTENDGCNFFIKTEPQTEFIDEGNEMEVDNNKVPEIDASSCTSGESYSFSETDNDEDDKPTKQPARTFNLIQTFQNKEDALTFVKNEDVWTINKSAVTKDGPKIYFRCKLGGHKNACPVMLHFQEITSTNQVNLYLRNDVEHAHGTHVHSSRARIGIPEERKNLIYDLFVSGLQKADLILKALKERNIEDVPRKQITNYISKLRKKMYGDLSFMRSNKGGGGEQSKKRKRKRKHRKRPNVSNTNENDGTAPAPVAVDEMEIMLGVNVNNLSNSTDQT